MGRKSKSRSNAAYRARIKARSAYTGIDSVARTQSANIVKGNDGMADLTQTVGAKLRADRISRSRDMVMSAVIQDELERQARGS